MPFSAGLILGAPVPAGTIYACYQQQFTVAELSKLALSSGIALLPHFTTIPES
jgi:hypothetical protein